MIFLNSVSSAASLVIYLPGVCTQTDTKGKQRKARVRNILKSLDKNTIFNEHPVYASKNVNKVRRIFTGKLFYRKCLYRSKYCLSKVAEGMFGGGGAGRRGLKADIFI